MWVCLCVSENETFVKYWPASAKKGCPKRNGHSRQYPYSRTMENETVAWEHVAHTWKHEWMREVPLQPKLWHLAGQEAEGPSASSLRSFPSAFMLSISQVSQSNSEVCRDGLLRRPLAAVHGQPVTGCGVKPRGYHLYYFKPGLRYLLCRYEDWRTMCLRHSAAPASLHPPPQSNNLRDDDGKNHQRMARPTHLLVHCTECTVILNKDQRETTGD